MFSTIDEIVNDLDAKLHPDARKELQEMSRADLIHTHHGFGMHVRNTYGLWGNSPLTEKWRTDESSHVIKDGCDYSPDHPDQLSMTIIEQLWERVQ